MSDVFEVIGRFQCSDLEDLIYALPDSVTVNTSSADLYSESGVEERTELVYLRFAEKVLPWRQAT